jgi:hypothetical protein
MDTFIGLSSGLAGVLVGLKVMAVLSTAIKDAAIHASTKSFFQKSTRPTA